MLSSLVKDTAVYGLSSMLGRFLNWLLTYIYARLLLPEGMGQMTKLYAWTAILLVVLTYGMETAFFRFANKSDKPERVYSTSLWAVGLSSLAFVLLGLGFSGELADTLGFANVQGGQYLVALVVLISALDAFCSIPLSFLRYAQRPWRFMAVRMSFVGLTVLATLGLYLLLKLSPESAVSQLFAEHTLLSILGINLLGCLLQLAMLLPSLRHASGGLDTQLLRAMLRYAWPILLLGLVGIFNSQADKLIFPRLFDNPQEGDIQLGIYATCYKIAVIMVLFTQAFRYAYDPFVFAKAKEGGDVAKATYALSTKYYLLFTLFIFLGVMSYLQLLKYFVTPDYYAGLPAVPLVMLGQLMFGLYFNLSVWYKLTDRTHWGAILSVLACLISILWIVLGAKSMGFMACAWAAFGSNALIMLVSYLLGQRYYPIAYPLKAMALYTALAMGLWAGEELFASLVGDDNLWLTLGFNTLMLSIFVGVVLQRELPRSWLKNIRARVRPSI